MTTEWTKAGLVRPEPDYGRDQHGLRCQCTRCTNRRLDNLFFLAAFDVRQAFGPGSVVVLGPEFKRPDWLSNSEAHAH